jgi:hypothetical protein
MEFARSLLFLNARTVSIITAVATCTVSINVLEPGAFNFESQYFIPLFNKISWLSGQQQRGDEASTGGRCNSGPIGHDFNIYRITLIFTFYCLPMRTGPFPKCENRSGSHIGCQVRTWAVCTSSGFSLRTELKTGASYQPTSENRPALVRTNVFLLKT